GAGFACAFLESSVHGGTIPTERAYEMDWPRCSAAWRTMNRRIPRCVFFPPNQSRLFSRFASGMPVIALRACAQESFSAAPPLALSVLDHFFRALCSVTLPNFTNVRRRGL